MASGRTDSLKAWAERNWSGSYHLVDIYNERPVYKRDEKTENDEDVYMWYHSGKKWRFTDGANFIAKNTNCWMHMNSSRKK